MTNLEVGDIVMCTVEKIEGTIVFVKIDENGEGRIVLSEIAPGRIRNLRKYVVPKKIIVCKVLRVSGENIDLSLRRVTPKEQKEIKEKYKCERSYQNILKSVLNEKSEKLIQEIKKQNSLFEFLEKAKKNPEELEKLTGKENTKKILEILSCQKEKEVSIKKEFKLTTTKPNGLELIKEVLENINEARITTISAGKYAIKIQGSNLKQIDTNLKLILENIEKQAKKKGLEFFR